MSTSDSPPISPRAAVARGLRLLIAGCAIAVAANLLGALPEFLWEGTNWARVLPRLLALAAALGLVTPLLRRAALPRWAAVPALPVAAALLRVLAGGAGGGNPWLWRTALAVEGICWLSVIIAFVFWAYTRPSRPPFAKQEPLADVLQAEARYLRERRELADLPASDRPVALSLSGGGVRSATTNLGLLQTLARRSLLRHFDYLSTVSGGGYVGAALSSLLSMRCPREGEDPCGGDSQYRFSDQDVPRFGVTPESFPFRESGGGAALESPDATAQVDHLRASGEFLVGRTGLFSLEFLRTVGTLVFGVLSHLLHFGLLAVSLAAGYLWVIWLMVGEYAVERGQRVVQDRDYLDYARGALGWDHPTGLWHHPFGYAFVAGFAITLLTVMLSRWLAGLFDPSRLDAPGRTRQTVEGEASTLTLTVVLLLNAIAITWWHIAGAPGSLHATGGELLNISLPLASYVGAGALLFCRWAWIATFSAPLGRQTYARWAWLIGGGYDSDDRSRLTARAGSVLYLVGASLILVLLVLPFLLFFERVVDFFEARQVKSVFAWMASVVGARYLARGAATAGARPATGRLSSLLPALKQALAAVAFIIAVLGALLLICAVIWRRASPEWRLPISLLSLGLYLVFGRVLDFNKLSLHYFYRDRLAEAFLMTQANDPDGSLRCVRDNEKMRLSQLHGECPGRLAATAAPYHLLLACLNLSSGDDRRRRSRKSDQFLFSKLYCGSETTGYVRTEERFGDETLARAMTLSGAAASPAMGSRTSFVQAASMTLLNLRLGQWLENPARHDPAAAGKGVFWPPYLFSEMAGATRAGGRRIYLSDGGHAGDNLGIYPLLKRRCRLIVAIDVEEDPEYLFHSFNEALRQILVDDRVRVEIELAALRPDAESGEALRHWELGLVTYPQTPEHPEEHGWLLLLKPSISGDEPEPVLNYKREYPDFPQQSTGDQFFDEAQFEAYREMGRHLLASCPNGLVQRLLEESASNELFATLRAESNVGSNRPS